MLKGHNTHKHDAFFAFQNMMQDTCRGVWNIKTDLKQSKIILELNNVTGRVNVAQTAKEMMI